MSTSRGLLFPAIGGAVMAIAIFCAFHPAYTELMLPIAFLLIVALIYVSIVVDRSLISTLLAVMVLAQFINMVLKRAGYWHL